MVDFGTGFDNLGRKQEALRLNREIYASMAELRPTHEQTILSGNNLCVSLVTCGLDPGGSPSLR